MSLTDCLKKANAGKEVFSAHEIKEIRAIANKQMGKVPLAQAEKAAVQQLLDAAIAERNSILKSAQAADNGNYSARIIDGVEYDGNADNFGLIPPPKTLKDNDPLLQDTSTINTPERQKMRDNMVDQHFDGIEPAFMRKPVAYIMGGGGASGKGTIGRKLANSGKIPQTNIVHLDPDEVKTNIEEYQLIKDAGDSRAAAVVHEESSEIAKRIRARAIAGRYDFINDVTLGDPVKAIKQLQDLKDAGYEVRLYGVTIDPATAVIRADLRARKPDSGRYVPVFDILKAHKGFVLNFEKYAAIVDHAELYENTDAPIKIIIKSQDKLDVIDQIAYDQIVKRSEVINEQAKTINEVGSLPSPQPSRADENQQSGNNESRRRSGSVQSEEAGRNEILSGKTQVTPNENQSVSQGSAQAQSPADDGGVAGGRKSGSVHRGAGERNIVRNNLPLLADSQEERVRPSPDATGEGGDTQRSNSAGKRNRAVRNAGVPAGRDIPAKSGLNYQFTDSDLDYKGGWITKAAQNVDAVELVKKLESEGRNATRAEQSILAKFVGWGAGEIRNQIFAPDLDARLSSIEDYETSIKALGDAKAIPSFSGNFYTAFKVLHAKDPTLNYYAVKNNPITRDMLEKAKPDMTLGKWGALRDRLKAAMTTEEWKTAERSTQYAHYTGKEVVQSMWQALDQFGFKGGSIIEPGAGIGVFPGLMNSAVANNSVYTGIEYDVLTGAILKHLQPDERILVESYIDSALPDNFYDVAIGNPPFSNTAVLSDPRYKKNGFALHDYFFAKTMDKVKPGGLLMFVSSRFTMDKQGDKARAYLAERADLLGAIRLPQTAFKKNAGTDVVTDILFLRKKVAGETFEGHPWMGLEKVKVNGGEHLINEYFAANPGMVLGEGAITRGRFSDHDYSVLPNKDTPIETQLAAAIAQLPKDAFNPAAGSAAQAALIREIDWNPKARKEGNFYVADDGRLMQVENRAGVPARVKGAEAEAMVRDFVPLRDAVNQAQYDQLNNGDWEKSLAALQKTYKAFVKKHGNILQNTEVERKSSSIDEDTGEKVEDVITSRRFTLLNKIDDDPEYTKVMALESINDETGVIKESDFLTKRTLDKRKDATISTPHDALLSVLNDTGKINIGAIAERIGLSKRETIESLGSAIYQSPTGEWQTEDEYLSGDVKQKLKEAQEAAKSNRRYERNVEALMSAQPAPVSSADIKASLGMNWIPSVIIEQFLKEKTGVKANILYNEHTGSWKIDLVSGHKLLQATDEWGTPKRNAGDIMEAALTGRPIRITETDKETKKTVFMADQTEAANQKLKQMREAFAKWMWQDGARADKMVQLYNDKFNTLVARKFDGRHLTLPGTTSTIQVFDHVKRGAWRIIQTGNTYLAHAVGSGKTWQMVIAAMEQKRLGMINKPMMVVPNHMLQQFAQEWLQLYPAARLMVADEKQFHTENRRRFISRVAMSDLDGVIITHSAFKLLDLDPEFKAKMIQEELDYMEAARDGILAEDGESDPKKSRNPKVRDIQNRIERMEEKLKALTSGEGKDQNVRFDEMGVDQLHVDEAHEFRKLAFTTSRQVKGIDSNGSDKAFDLYMKTRWLEEKHPKRSLVMASGTVITNTLAEMFSVQRFMQPTMLANRGLEDFDAWASMFGEEHSEIEADASGKYAPVTRFSKFVNVPELTQMFREFADVLTSEHLAEMLGDKRPKVAGGSRKLMVTPQVDDYLTYKDELAQRLRISRDWKPSREEPNNPDPIIKIIGDGRLAAIDMRFIDPSLPSDPNSKLNQMIDGVIRVYKETADNEYQAKDGKKEPIKGGSQMIFSDLGFGAGVAANRGFNARVWLEKRMRDAGVAPKDIAFIGDYKKSAAKVKLFKDVNTGKVRILIGSSKSMGTGVNAQQRLIALHHLDTPWFPADLEQREGRIVRQGNKNPHVQIYAYSTKGSYDTVMWQLLARKQRFIDQALSGDSSVRELDDISETSQFQMATAMTAGDERAIRLAGLKSDIEKYQRLSRAHQDTRMRLKESYLQAKYAVVMAEERLPDAENLAAKMQDLSGVNFKGKAGSKQFDTRKEFGEALLAKLKEYSDKTKEGRDKVGELSGFPIEIIGKIDRNSDDKPIGYNVRLAMKIGENEVVLSRDPMDDPVGITIRATNAMTRIARLPDEHRQNIADAKSKINSLESRLDTPFQFAEELAIKQGEVAELEAAMLADSIEKNKPKEDVTVLPSQAGKKSEGMTSERVQLATAKLRASWVGFRRILVVQSVRDVPNELYLRALRALKPIDQGTEGVYDVETRSVYLIADNISSPERAVWVAAHEVAGHGGVRMLGGLVAAELNRAAKNPFVTKLAQAIAEDRAEKFSAKTHTDEALAELAAATVTGKMDNILERYGIKVPQAMRNNLRGMIQRVIDAVRGFMAKMLKKPATEIRDTDIHALISKMIYVVQGKDLNQGPPSGSETTGDTVLSSRSAAGNAVRLKKSTDSILRPVKKETMEQDTSKLDHLLGGKFLFQAAGAILTKSGAKRLASGVYTNLLERVGAESFADLIPETVKAGVVSDYGLTPEYQDRKAEMKAAEAAQNRKSSGMVEMLAGLTRAESRVAYQWMQEKPDTQTEALLMAQLPKESREILGKLKDMISSLGEEAVRLGQLSPEAFERNNMAYVNRSYAKHVIGTEGKIAAFFRTRSLKIKGNQYKGRGIFDEVTMREVSGDPMFWRKLQQGRADNSLLGEKLVRYERRDASTKTMDALPGMESKPLGKLREVVYWPVSQAVPTKFGGWVDAGTFEVRGTKGDKLVVWRDFTKEERTRMGELDEVRYAVAQTLQMMVHDIEIGRFFEWNAKEYGKLQIPADGKEVKASEAMYNTFGKNDWVQVPSIAISKTTTKKYGALAGLYIPGTLWNDLRQVGGLKFDNPILAAHEKTLQFWKKAKTAWSPAVHMNNVMANFVIADWHDLKSADLAEGLKVWANKNKSGYKEIFQRFEDSGALGGMFLSNEALRDEIAKQLETMKDELTGTQADTELSRLSKVMHLVTMAGMVPVKGALAYTEKMEDAYQFEDAVFRLASFTKAIRYGKTDIEAGRIARHSFLNYDINAPWVQMARHSFLPFISFFYRAMPMALSTVKNKPWKVVKLLAFYQLASMLGAMMAGSGDDDEEKNRKLMPDAKTGDIWGLVPKMIRMGWNHESTDPVYLDVRRWVPVGDVVDVGQSSSNLPSWATPGGVLPLLAEVFIFNKSVFTTKNITGDSDSFTEAAEKKFDYLFKGMLPNVPLPNPLNVQIGGVSINPFNLDQGSLQPYAWSGIEKAVDRKENAIGEVRSIPMAVAGAFGIKAAAYPHDNMKAALVMDFQKEAKEIEGEMKKDARDYSKLADPTPAQKAIMERGIKKQSEKLNELATKLRERIN